MVARDALAGLRWGLNRIAQLSRRPLAPAAIIYPVLILAVPVLGIVANPHVVNPDGLFDPVGDAILIGEGLVGALLGVEAVLRGMRRGTGRAIAEPLNTPEVHDRIARVSSLLLGFTWLLIVALWLMIHRDRIARPTLFADDFQYIDAARTWAVARQHLLVPYNEHYCVPTRLLTWSVCAAASPEHWPRALALAGMTLFALCLPLLYRFLSRELGSPVLGMLGVILFALTDVHAEVIRWYSASQWLWGLAVLLTSLLVLQVPGGSPGWLRLLTSGLCALIGPLCYSLGLLVGPISSIYLAIGPRQPAAGRILRIFLPTLATVAVFSVLASWSAQFLLEHSNLNGKKLVQAFDPAGAVLYAVRSTVDLLVFRNLGWRSSAPRWLYAMVFGTVVALLISARRRPDIGGLPVLGMAVIILAYACALPFRTWVAYPTFMSWSRYQLFPQLGLVFLATGIVHESGWLRDWLRSFAWPQAMATAAAALLLGLVHAR